MARHLFLIDGIEHPAVLSRGAGGYRLQVGDAAVDVALEPLGEGRYRVLAGGHSAEVWLAHRGEQTFVQLEGAGHTIEWRDPLVYLARGSGGGLDDVAAAPMPGTVIAVKVKPGDAVTKGQTMVVIESMKLETAINAWRDGTVAAVHVANGQTFDRAAALVTLDPEAGG